MEAVEMTADERAQFEAFKAEKEAKKLAERFKAEKEEYKKIVEREVNEAMQDLMSLSAEIENVKKVVYDRFLTILAMKNELFKVPSGQFTHTFSTSDFRLALGYRCNDGYDDTVNEGISIVHEYLSSLADDDKSKMLVNSILKLLSRNAKGDLKASRVIQLRQLANESGSQRFMEGVQIIEEAYRPETTKRFISAAIRRADGSWNSIPLSITDAPYSENKA